MQMQIEPKDLSTGQWVWYRYSKLETVYGPAKVKRFFSNQLGPQVVVRNIATEADVIISLAHDDDFGEPLFYDSDPGA